MRIRCPNCRTILTVPESSAGKRARCTECRGEMEIPRIAAAKTAVEDDEEDDYDNPDAELFRNLPVADDPYARSPADETTCGACGQRIPRRTERCPYCDVDRDVPLPPPTRKKKKPTKEEILSKRGLDSNADLGAGDILLAVFCSGIGLILGIMHMISGDSKGWKMVVISLVADFVKLTILLGVKKGMH